MITHKVTIEEGICAAARRLLREGVAQPEDKIEAYRGADLCLISRVGAAAELTASDNSRGVRFKKWRPMNADTNLRN